MNLDYKKAKYVFRYICFRLVPPFLYSFILKVKYKNEFKQKLNLKSAQKLSEKIQYLKLNNKNIKKTLLSDKLKAKEYIKTNLPELKFAKVYQSASKFEELDLNILPSSFILKTNHAWKTNTFIKDKNKLTEKELKELKNYYNWVLNINYAYWSFYELQYKEITAKVYAEEILDTYDTAMLIPNYEIFCFNGKAKFILLRNANEYFQQYIYDTNWKRLNFDISYGNDGENPKPKFLEKIIYYAEFLSKDIDFVRVDFMTLNEEPYFCEMTFTPNSGFIKFNPPEFDLYYGKELIID